MQAPFVDGLGTEEIHLAYLVQARLHIYCKCISEMESNVKNGLQMRSNAATFAMLG